MSSTPAAAGASSASAPSKPDAKAAQQQQQQSGKKAPYELTPEQRAKRAARAQLKQAKKAALEAEGSKPLRSAEQLAKGEFRKREWVKLDGQAGEGERKIKVMSWNVSPGSSTLGLSATFSLWRMC